MSRTSLPSVEELAKSLEACKAALDSYRNASSSDPAGQTNALARVREVAQQLQQASSTPAEQLSIVRNGGQRAAVLRLAIAIDLFKHVSEREALSITQLAQQTDATPEFAHRIARALASLGFLNEDRQPSRSDGGPTTMYDTLAYTATPLGAYFASQPDQHTAMSYIYDVHVAALCAMGDYIAQHGRQSPVDSLNCPTVFAQGAKDIDYFAQMQKRPDRAAEFERTMYLMNQASFADMSSVYPFDGLRAPERPDAEGVVLVDVGGGDGRMLKRLREKFPGMKGRVVLQDLPAVVERGTVLDEIDGVEVMTYDFFAGEQPVKGAAAYFHQHIFHDWPDDACRTILRNLRPAMSSHSRLLLSEMIVPNYRPDINRCIADINMMVVGGQERSKAQWTALLASEGFHVKGFYGECNAVNGIIEAVRDDDA